MRPEGAEINNTAQVERNTNPVEQSTMQAERNTEQAGQNMAQAESVAAQSREPLMSVRDLVKSYPLKGQSLSLKRERTHAVNGVSFKLYAGETLALVGESGCGKSTAGRLLTALEKPDSGEILYRGLDLTQAKTADLRRVRTELQMIFQDSNASLNPRKHIYEILAAPLLYHRMESKASVERRVDELLDLVGLPKSSKGRYAHEFSGGQRQRIGIARALSLKPRIIVCDEAVSALDVSIQAQILNLLLSLQKDLGLTYLFISHGLAAVNYVSQRIAVMYLGRIVELASAKELFRAPLHPYTRALINAAPIPDPLRRERHGRLLKGEAPSNVELVPGCSFHPRCVYAQESCRIETPQLLPLWGADERHLLACPVMAERFRKNIRVEQEAE